MLIQINGKSYEVIQENRNGWDAEAFKQRYSDVLERYDYIIGDWGYNQLRLKGFYRDNHPKVNRDTSISGIVDYINEYCNFGCPYFVLQRVKDGAKDPALALKEHAAVKEEGSLETAQNKETRPNEAHKETSKKSQGKPNKAITTEAITTTHAEIAKESVDTEPLPLQSLGNQMDSENVHTDADLSHDKLSNTEETALSPIEDTQAKQVVVQDNAARLSEPVSSSPKPHLSIVKDNRLQPEQELNTEQKTTDSE